MPPAPDLQPLSPTLWLWQVYKPAIKSDLFSCAVKSEGGQLFLIDPIPLGQEAFAELSAQGPIAGILITNANHQRAAADFAQRLQCTIFASEGAAEPGSPAEILTSGEALAPGVIPIGIGGAAPGETAFHFSGDRGTLVIGDALIHFEPYGFALLPPKYCSDQKAMRRSLRQLLDWPFERLLFAHGLPILSDARGRLQTLLK